MRGRDAIIYGIGRLAFGAGLFAAPAAAGSVMLGDESGRPGARVALRAYGTRDVLLGGGAIYAGARGGDALPWVAAGMAADVLDVALQALEWNNLPPDKRIVGIAAAAGAAAGGAWLLATQR